MALGVGGCALWGLGGGHKDRVLGPTWQKEVQVQVGVVGHLQCSTAPIGQLRRSSLAARKSLIESPFHIFRAV